MNECVCVCVCVSVCVCVTNLPGSDLSSSRLRFFRSTSSGCPATVADDDTTPRELPVDGGVA